MGFFDAFTGAAQKKAIGAANQQATGYINQGYNQARGEINQGQAEADRYYGQARDDLQGGYDRATAASGQGLAQARGDLDPYARAGTNALGQYETALGLRGQDAQRAFLSSYASSDPFRQFNEYRTQNALARQYNARGMSNSGMAALAGARASQEQGSTDYNNYLNRLSGLSQQGQQAAGQQAGYAFSQGQQMGQYGYNLGQGWSGVAGQQAQSVYNTGSNLAQLSMGQNNALASNAINYGNAQAAASGIGVNNLMKLGGLAAQVYGMGG